MTIRFKFIRKLAIFDEIRVKPIWKQIANRIVDFSLPSYIIDYFLSDRMLDFDRWAVALLLLLYWHCSCDVPLFVVVNTKRLLQNAKIHKCDNNNNGHNKMLGIMSPIDNNWRIELKPNARFHHFCLERFIKSHTFAFRAMKEQQQSFINSKIIA